MGIVHPRVVDFATFIRLSLSISVRLCYTPRNTTPNRNPRT